MLRIFKTLLGRDAAPPLAVLGKQPLPSVNAVKSSEMTTDTDDHLGYFIAQLKERCKTNGEMVEKWIELRSNIYKKAPPGTIFKKETGANASPSDQQNPSLLNKLIDELFHKIKNCIVTPHADLQKLLEETMGKQVEELCKQLTDLSQALKETKIEQEKYQLEMDMCNVSICMLNQQMKLTEKMSEEIKSCLAIEEAGIAAATKLAQMAVLLLTAIPLPDPNLHLNESYRKHLQEEINADQDKFFMIEGDSAKAAQDASLIIDEKNKADELAGKLEHGSDVLNKFRNRKVISSTMNVRHFGSEKPNVLKRTESMPGLPSLKM